MTDANGLQSQYSYDLRGRVLNVTKTPPGGLARVTRTTYDFAGQVSSVTTPDHSMRVAEETCIWS